MDFIGSQIMLPLLSSVASLIVSVIVFAIGVRIGKAQADRGTLRDLYKALFTHFLGLKNALEKGRPKQWSDFPLIGNEYRPPVREMELNGNLNLLPKKLALKFLSTEKEVLITTWKFRKHLEEIVHPTINSFVHDNVQNPEKAIERMAYLQMRPGELLIQEVEKLKDIKHRLETEQLGVAVEISLEKGLTKSLYIYSETIKGISISKIIDQLEDLVRSNSDTNHLIGEFAEHKKSLGIVLGTLSARIKDPHPLIETVLEVVPDLFKR